MGANFDIFAADASTQARSARNAANANLDASIIAIQMIKEMRDWETTRFNDVIAALRNRKHENEAIMAEINGLKAQVAGLQKRLYEEEQKNKGIAR